VYEIPTAQVRVVDTPVLWPLRAGQAQSSPNSSERSSREILPNAERVKDQEFFSDFYPSLKTLLSKSAGTLYWKGPLDLIDGSYVEVVAMENSQAGAPFYSIIANCPEPALAKVLTQYRERPFRSARHAILHLQKDFNYAIYRNKKG
jgi:hypothetical protein